MVFETCERLTTHDEAPAKRIPQYNVKATMPIDLKAFTANEAAANATNTGTNAIAIVLSENRQGTLRGPLGALWRFFDMINVPECRMLCAYSSTCFRRRCERDRAQRKPCRGVIGRFGG
jgi:hypothetical protein